MLYVDFDLCDTDPNPSFNFFFFLIYSWLGQDPAALGLRCLHGPSLVAVSGVYSWLCWAGFLLKWHLLWSIQSKHMSFSSCLALAWLLHGISSSTPCIILIFYQMWNLPVPGIKPMAPALADRLLSTTPTEKSRFPSLNSNHELC